MKWLKRLLGRKEADQGSNRTGPKAALSADREAALVEVDALVQREVAARFKGHEDIVETAVEVLMDEFEPQMVRALATERVQHHEQQLAAAATNWPATTDCDRLDRAFRALEAAGIVCRQNFTCCQTCGNAEIHDEITEAIDGGLKVRGYAYYHMQDTERAVEGSGLYLAYGAMEKGEEPMVAMGQEITQALRDQGLQIDWDGTPSQRIFVTMDWKRRHAPQCKPTRRR